MKINSISFKSSLLEAAKNKQQNSSQVYSSPAIENQAEKPAPKNKKKTLTYVLVVLGVAAAVIAIVKRKQLFSKSPKETPIVEPLLKYDPSFTEADVEILKQKISTLAQQGNKGNITEIITFKKSIDKLIHTAQKNNQAADDKLQEIIKTIETGLNDRLKATGKIIDEMMREKIKKRGGTLLEEVAIENL